jgi:hypothetical protein
MKNKIINRGGYIRLYPEDAENILDALNEWDEEIGPKELEENEVGLNGERYEKLKNKLEAITND